MWKSTSKIFISILHIFMMMFLPTTYSQFNLSFIKSFVCFEGEVVVMLMFLNPNKMRTSYLNFDMSFCNGMQESNPPISKQCAHVEKLFNLLGNKSWNATELWFLSMENSNWWCMFVCVFFFTSLTLLTLHNKGVVIHFQMVYLWFCSNVFLLISLWIYMCV